MAASRRGQPPLSVRLPKPSGPQASLPDLPPISALFLIDFDVKAGYTIIWKRAVPGLELEGVVEYKSLPSGLHTVTDDLIYFVHDGGHAGLSAFINTRTEDEGTRNARMIAVGILVPLSYGRLGRAWRHAEALKEMATQLTADRKQTDILEKYWKEHGVRETTAPQPQRETPLASPVVTKPKSGHARNRSASDGTALIPPGHRLSPYHPAWSLTTLLEAFGPLIFPIHRAALLRKRILISTHAPVHEVCNFVYDISILSNIPHSITDILDPDAPTQRLRPLFTVGVHDIPSLADHADRKPSTSDQDSAVAEDPCSGWIACTTDSILAVKGELWDMLITMPPPYASAATERAWPTVESPKGTPVRATQRDLRRFKHLQSSLARLTKTSPTPSRTVSASTPAPGGQPSSSTTSPQTATSDIRLSATHGPSHRPSPLDISDYESEKLVEPSTWASLAYSGFMWWASAGEQRRGEEIDEGAQDAALFADLGSLVPTMSMSLGGTPGLPTNSSLGSLGQTGGETDDEDAKARIELAIIAYFHRLTTQILSVLADVVDGSDEDDILGMDVAQHAAGRGDTGAGGEGERDRLLRLGVLSVDEDGEDEEGQGAWIRVDSDALANMGLDVWSQSDAEFVRDLTPRYFARRAWVEGKGVEVCGLRVC
ncbi:hypothetical protein GE09DRAFT_1043556 [Coniochaeta sp. 2T2.1]|nr:hypothetical protein GE09DRAFT_1043556 [Coniochaeta sp. 2T2.1]